MIMQAIHILCLFCLKSHHGTKSNANKLILVSILTTACVYDIPLHSAETSDFVNSLMLC